MSGAGEGTDLRDGPLRRDRRRDLFRPGSPAAGAAPGLGEVGDPGPGDGRGGGRHDRGPDLERGHRGHGDRL